MIQKTYKNRQEFLHKISSAITKGVDDEVRPLIYLAYEKGITQTEIAKALGVSESAVSQKYPLLKFKK